MASGIRHREHEGGPGDVHRREHAGPDEIAFLANPKYRNQLDTTAAGAVVLDVGQGEQACGETGDGRMLEPEEILFDLIAHFQAQALAGRRVLITAGLPRRPGQACSTASTAPSPDHGMQNPRLPAGSMPPRRP